MKKQNVDPFFVGIGKALGVSPEKIRLKHTQVPGEFTLIGPKPKSLDKFTDLPTPPDDFYELDYCFTFVLRLPPPAFACAAYRREYEDLKQQLPGLIQAEAWDDILAVVQRLEELKKAIDRCIPREWVFTYCIFPTE